MKNTFLTLLATVALFGLAACDDKAATDAQNEQTSAIEQSLSDAAAEFASDAEAQANEAFEAAEEMATDAKEALEPAAGEAEAEADKAMDSMPK